MESDNTILVIDVGNTTSECGIYQDDTLIDSWRFMTKTPRTSDEYAVVLRGFLKDVNLNLAKLKMLSSHQ